MHKANVPLPARMQSLQRDPDPPHYVVPWFVNWNGEGKPDFRVIAPTRIHEALVKSRCWLCGERLGSDKTFVIGPMCAINRVTSEPPCHIECAEYAVQVCPFLTKPKMKRNDKDLPDHGEMPGIGLKRNPGVSLLYTTKRFQPIQVPARPGLAPGVLMDLGEPWRVSWWKEGRTATREEVMEAIEGGKPILEEMAKSERNQLLAEQRLQRMYDRALLIVPKESEAA